MTNGEKLKEIFPDIKIITQYDNPFGDRFMVFTLNNEDMQVNIDWWNAEYKESTIKNDLGVDLISRADALDCVNWGYNLSDVYKKINELTSVTPQLSSKLEKNSQKLEKDFGESDCISRADALKLMKDNWSTHNGDWAMQESMDDIRALPSVTPIRPKGHWIEYSWNDNGFGRWGLKCDKCHKKYKYAGEIWGNSNFCPNCGADMREVEE